MTIEALKQQLSEGKITQEQFATELKKLLDTESITQEQYDEALKTDDGGKKGGLTEDDIKKLIQSETDKVRTEYAKKLKAEQDEKERLLKEKMTDEEKAKFERDKLANDLADREAELTKREVALHTVDELRKLELPLEFRDILVGPSKDDTNARIKTFAEQWQKAINDAVAARFKEHGGDHQKGKKETGDKNPWSKESFNLTEQGRIYREDRQKAIQLAAAAGVTLN